ncbi:MAG TPA: bile acid:sodium symporter family protein [Myxococcota bacterium]|nr:bile acid:sodium symporter family protein [Myxococcota bacterium]
MTAQDIVKLYIPVTLGVIMFTMGLGLALSDFKRIVVEPRAMWVGLINQLVTLPLVAFGLAFAFDLPPALAVGLIVISACPGGPSSNLYSALARGDVALSVSLTAVSGVITMVTIPIIIGLGLDVFMGAQREVHLDVPSTILQLFLVVGLPLSIGMYVRFRHVERAMRLEKVMTKVAVLLLLTLIIGAVMKERARLGEYFGILGLPIIILSLSTTLFGLFSALAFRLSMRQSVTIGIEVGMQNAALGMGLAMTSLGSEEIAMPAALYGIIAYFTTAVALLIGRRFIRPPRPSQ